LQNFVDQYTKLYPQSMFIYRIKKIEEESSCEIKFQMQLKPLSF